MAVTRIKESFNRRRSSRRLTGKDSLGNATYISEHTRSFKAWCDDPADGTAAVLDSIQLPQPGEPHPHDPLASVTDIQVQPLDGDDRHFEVEIEYSSDNSSEGTTTDTTTPPLNRPWEVSWGGTASTEPYFIDHSSPPKAVTNTAGEPFEQFFERESSELTISIVKNEGTGAPGTDDLYSNTTNQNSVFIEGTLFLERTLKLSPIQSRKQVETVNGMVYTFYRKTYTIKARRRGWIDEPIDAGLNELLKSVETIDGTPQEKGVLTPIVDKNGLPIVRPWPLDGEGRKLPSPLAQPITLVFVPYEAANWTPLGLRA